MNRTYLHFYVKMFSLYIEAVAIDSMYLLFHNIGDGGEGKEKILAVYFARDRNTCNKISFKSVLNKISSLFLQKQ